MSNRKIFMQLIVPLLVTMTLLSVVKVLLVDRFFKYFDEDRSSL